MKRQRNFSNMKSKKTRKKRKTNLGNCRDSSIAKETQRRNKEVFDKSYFGSEYVNTWKYGHK